MILNANKELLALYWNIGKTIEENSLWENKFINDLAMRLQKNFLL